MRRGVAIAVAVGVSLTGCGGGKKAVEQTAPVQLEPANDAAGCGPVTRYPDEGHAHVPKGTVVDYKTEPPTSGDHLQIWTKTGTYASEIPDEIQVHNLEHGHVIIQYVPGKVAPAVLSGFVKLVRANPKWMIVAPRTQSRFDDAAAAVSFTAWRTMEECTTPTALAVEEARAFFARYAKHGRELIAGEPIFETPPPR